jgi:hypothetical protein
MTAAVPAEVPSTWELYQRAADEVRWQVQLGEQRATRLTTFVALVLAAGVGLRDTKWSALVFVLGSACAAFASRAVLTDHRYYRSVRDQMVTLADRVDQEVGYPVTPRATSGQGSRQSRGWWQKVQTAQQALFVTMGVVGIVGAISVLV